MLFENTNNLRQGFERIDSDLRNYYLVGYTPANDTYDGKFRNIDVKVKRPGVTVAARKGYFAVRDAGGAPVNTWEAPALAALDRRPVPNAFPVRAGALLFPERGSPRAGAGRRRPQDRADHVPADRGSEDLSSPTSPSSCGSWTRKNQVVEKVGQHYEMTGAMDKLESAKQGEVLFYREPELPPGVYTMETIVYDNPSRQGERALRDGRGPEDRERDKLRMSSLVIVKRGEKVPERRAQDRAAAREGRPDLSRISATTVSKTAKELGFFFTVYPVAGVPAPQALLELIQNGKPLAQVPLPLDAADAVGANPAGGPAADRGDSSRHVRAAGHRQAGDRAGISVGDGARRGLDRCGKLS